jgi:uncharacterized membrane protein YeaQ/YmgE (transglycosylase-associated protein family)
MTITGIVSLLVTGAIVGGLGRLVVPGKQAIPTWLTILVGTAAAFVGDLLAASLGWTGTPGIDWLAVLLQVVFAAIGVVSVAHLYARRGVRRAYSYRPGPARRAVGFEQVPSRSDVAPADTGATARPLQQTQPRRPPVPVTKPVPPPVSVVPPPAPPVAPVRPPSRIFVSYRRDDSWLVARTVVDQLRKHVAPAEVFLDVDDIEHGADFVDAVQAAIRASAVVLVLIGNRWLAVGDDSGRRRLDDPDDNVRMEIEYALQLQKMIIPVLVNDAVMPRKGEVPDSLDSLLRRHAVPVGHLSWHADLDALIRVVLRTRSEGARGGLVDLG